MITGIVSFVVGVGVGSVATVKKDAIKAWGKVQVEKVKARFKK